ncbi:MULTISPECIES: DUF1302 domain-containing protein [unclassified Pseudomonas]|uniref:DUF1302 domain-containing protein n=1 Tax=unclassified Pseudomonas TaxID=196821 RepID=UPI0016147AD3|nr:MULTISPECIES: DUF1302 domain-containing protein [unclassified Pseudomonas]MBB6290516.1 hypothetical protein [Pseudomonas sp. SJZ073]MBB6315757.1 hypothetical protein [Pseudomonas sp. JAI120]
MMVNHSKINSSFGAVFVYLAFSQNCMAVQFDLSETWRAQIDSSVSVGSAWRTQSPSKLLYTRLNGERVGRSGGLATVNVDGGDLNYSRGDRFSTPYKLLSDIQITNGQYGGLLRIKAWYDDALENSGVHSGSQANGYKKGGNLDDSGAARLARYKGIEALDSYVWGKFATGGGETEVRAGRQSIPWGGSLFFQGINQVNPVNFSALRKPGADLQKEMYIPIWSLYTKFTFAGGGAVDAFYQLKWQPSVFDTCGPYWVSFEMGLSTKAGGTCQGAALLPGNTSEAQYRDGNYLPLGDGREGSDSGQFGIAYHYPLELINTEIGLYAMQLNSRMPIISARTGDDPPGALLNGPKSVENIGLRPAEGFWEYPDNIRIFGITTKSKVRGWALGSELSYTPNQPVQRNANDIVMALFQGTGPLGQQSIIARDSGVGVDVGGYDRLKKAQFTVNAATALPAMLYAQKGTFASEVAVQYVDVGDSFTGIRYGRGFIYGSGAHESLGGGHCLTGNTQPDGCRDDGYVTKYSWGYRLKGQLDYSVSYIAGLWVSPNVYFAHDVSGFSSDGQMVEGRKQLGLGVKFAYQSLTMDVSYVNFSDSAKYDTFRDHDYANAALTYKF